jgi:hypothetical protein
MSKSPLAIVKEKFGEKSKLVEALSAFQKDDLWVDRTNKNKGLERVSNEKLLRLFGVFSVVKEKFGTRAKLIDALLALEKRSKDAGYKKRLEAYPVPRLYDAYRSAARRAGMAAPAAKPASKSAAAKAQPAAKKAEPKGGAKPSSKEAKRKA